MSGTALVIEDDASVRRVARKILERAGYAVVAAANAETGLEILEDQSVDIVLTDLILPGLGGRDVLTTIRSTGSRLPVVVMSGYAADSPGDPGDLPPGVLFLQKPFSPDDLIRIIQEALGAD